ncbi:alpha/beta fold hydrolase [Pseudobacteriovorax antillogorgiicola]|uniref:Pimeloyl-ACP methyl ester carboxylesterase n=1 Tax=Pseudobacteriovorax antillogorgiicola TaxID=1513793 RepID=A0A1Y6CE42_9BACT|nr:alpha/beta hydrolase [Pseudobacteriovorax antillogorgiicola]TCS47944.1 hypothetical protein EDD56_11955 [Pseudobacteriovorax antillogorgiicola]SMF58092.1 hypothetical protein SAMN06296036_11956 [Pseudobacteriovorax antillogorgiicola]
MNKIIFSLCLISMVSCRESSSKKPNTVPTLEGPGFRLGSNTGEKIERPKDGCENSGTETIRVLADHHDETSRYFNYRYQRVVNDPQHQTIIHVPGGPGQGLMGVDGDSYSTQYNHILIDPRGLGCNYQPKNVISDKFINTDQHTRDIIEIIRQLNLDSYAFYGVSYGTVVGTHFGHLIKDIDDINLPQAIVLEGIVGQAMRGDSYQQEFKKQWDRNLQRVSGLDIAFSDSNNLPFGYNVSQWNQIIQTLLSVGGESGKSFLRAAADPERYNIGKVKETLDRVLKDEPAILGERRFYNLVGCQEVFENTRYINYLTSGRFEVYDLVDYLEDGVTLEQAVGRCNSMDLSNPFDSSNFVMIDIPTYYVQGENDPNTPQEGARYHFENQVELSQKYFINVEGAGHNPLAIQLDDCSDQVWENIFSGEDPRDKFTLRDNGSCFGYYYESASALKIELQKLEFSIGKVF